MPRARKKPPPPERDVLMVGATRYLESKHCTMWGHQAFIHTPEQRDEMAEWIVNVMQGVYAHLEA